MRILVTLTAALVAAAVPANAGEIHKFNQTEFKAIQARNGSAVVFVHAPWCPVCRAQEVTIKKLLASPDYKDVAVLTIDFDTQKSLWSSFKATQQSTLIGFHGRRETGRLAYNADPQRVTAVFASTLR
jgi:hypothetical protein